MIEFGFCGLEIPEPDSLKGYSGQFSMRLAAFYKITEN